MPDSIRDETRTDVYHEASEGQASVGILPVWIEQKPKEAWHNPYACDSPGSHPRRATTHCEEGSQWPGGGCL